MFAGNVVINSNTNQRNALSFANCSKLWQSIILPEEILFLNYKKKSLVQFSNYFSFKVQIRIRKIVSDWKL